MSSDCREFSELLLDLAYDELEDAEAARLRSHAATCPACAAELDSVLLTRKLARDLPPPEPDPRLADAVLAAAERAAAAFAERPSESAVRDERSVREIAERAPTVIDRLRAALFKPAFATALAATVVFAISFYLYRNAASERSDESGTPGAPFFGPAGALSAAPPAPAQPAAAVAGADGARAAEPPVGLERPEYRRERPAAARSVAQAKGSLGTAGPALVNSADELDRAGAALGDIAAAAPAAEAASSLAQGDTGYGGGGQGEAAKKAAPAPTDQDAADLFDQGMAAYDRGDCAAATSALERVVDYAYAAPPGVVPVSLHHLARCARRSGSCGRAVVYYERLFSEHPSYRDRAEAMWEAAACHRRLGHVEEALALLRSLSELPDWGAKADAETKSIEGFAADP